MPSAKKTVLKLLGSLTVISCLVLSGCGGANQNDNTATKEAAPATKASAVAEKPAVKQAVSFEADDVQLGGIHLGMSYDEVVRLKGKPTKEEKGYAQLIHKVIFYGNDVEIGFCNDKVHYVTVTADNDWKTPSGIHVGMSLDEAMDIYDTEYKTITSPSQRPESSKKSPFYEMRWQGIRYKYRCVPSDEYTNKREVISWELMLTAADDQAEEIDAITIMEFIPES